MKALRLLALGLLCSACPPRLFVNVLQPAPVNLGAAKKLSVLQSQGRKSSRDAMLAELKAQLLASGYFTLADHSEDGFDVKVVGKQVSVTGGALAVDEVGLRIDVLEWNADRDTVSGKDDKGNTVPKQIWVGRVLVQLTAFDAGGRAFVSEKEYREKWEDERDEDTAILGACKRVVERMLQDLTPTYEQKAIRLDDEDVAQKPIIDLATQGADLPKAVEAEKALLEKTPKSAPGLYNLAVLLDAQGLYADALPLYEQAIALAPKDFYFDMKRECAARLEAAKALAQ